MTALAAEPREVALLAEAPANVIATGAGVVWWPIEMIALQRWPWSVERRTTAVPYERMRRVDDTDLSRWFANEP